MPTFYVEVWQPTGQTAEMHASFAEFQEAVAWRRIAAVCRGYSVSPMPSSTR